MRRIYHSRNIIAINNVTAVIRSLNRVLSKLTNVQCCIVIVGLKAPLELYGCIACPDIL